MKNEKLIPTMICLALPTCIFLVFDGCISASSIIFEENLNQVESETFEDIYMGVMDDLNRKHAQDMMDIEHYYQSGGFQ